jgi:type II secretory pathway component PulC
VGFQVYPGASGGAFYQLGLKPGDVILNIDGIPLNEQTTAWSILRQIAEGSVMSARIKRSAGAEQLTLDGTIIVRAEETRMLGPARAMQMPPVQ